MSSPERQSEATPTVDVRNASLDILDALPIGIIAFDRNLEIQYRNGAASCLLPDGKTADRILASGMVEGHCIDWPSELRKVMSVLRESRWSSVTSPDRGGGSEILLNLVCTPLTGPDDKTATGGILIVQDITQQASLERKLAISERLAAVGKLSAKIAHELNNPLDGIMRYINLARRVAGDDYEGKVSDYLDKADTGLKRMAAIISDLLEFSRSQPKTPGNVHVNQVLEDAIQAMSEPADNNRVAIAASFNDEGMPVVHSSRLFQVACNLIKNAIDAMENGGHLTLTTARHNDEVVILFEDTGPGLPDDIMKIFEPFYTTKKPGKGTGLGLAICKDYIERLHGTITAENREEGGARFILKIPVSALETEVPDR